MTITAPVDGDLLDVAWAEEITDALNAMLPFTQAWTTFVPAWSSSGTQPAIGNGTLTGQYIRAGNTVIAWGTLTVGSTTTFGTGSYRLSLPVAGQAATAGPGVVWIFDSGTASRTGATYWIDASTLWLTAANGGDITPTNPQTFATGDIISYAIVYRVS